MNSTLARSVLASLNPSLHFEVGDVNRLPLFPIESADAIVSQFDVAFTEHEAAREASVEFKRPAPSVWRYAQEWAQLAVDRPAGEPLPSYCPEYDPEPPASHVSCAMGVALGRFGAHGEGILDEAHVSNHPGGTVSPSGSTCAPSTGTPPATALPGGVLYLSTYGSSSDGLSHPASHPIIEAWERHGASISKSDLRTWLRVDFFASLHKPTYENRPTWFPLSSSKRNFVAWVAIHRWHDATMQTLLADHLHPEMTRLEKEIAEVLEARSRADAAGKARSEKRLALIQPLREELRAFMDAVAQCAEKGAPKADPRDPAREVDARFRMDLDDGVMIHSAALWPLLEPQWKEPRKWWRELCRAEGRKDYDWAHLAARYFPQRVDGKCQVDPSLGVAHGCFWKYHPEKACAWELRLQDEIGPDFQLREADSDTHRAALMAAHPERVQEIRDAEAKRRVRKSASRDSDPDASSPCSADDSQPGLFDDEDPCC